MCSSNVLIYGVLLPSPEIGGATGIDDVPGDGEGDTGGIPVPLGLGLVPEGDGNPPPGVGVAGLVPGTG